MSFRRLPHWSWKLFSNIHTMSSEKRSILQLNDSLRDVSMLQTRRIGFASANHQSFKPLIPPIDIEKHRRPYLPRRALM